MGGSTPAGWYPDPQRRAAQRWWDGRWWTAWESDGSRSWLGSPPEPSRPLAAADVPALGVIRTVFLVEAQRRGVVPVRQAEALARLADDLAAEVLSTAAGPVTTLPRSRPTGPAAPPPIPAAVPTPAPPAGPVPSGAPVLPGAPAPSGAPVPAPAPAGVPAATHDLPRPAPATWSSPGVANAGPAAPRPAPTAVPVPRAPGRVARWWAASRLRLDTDLTVHGLTYLGVLLLFVGVFGLVAFAFGDVSPGLRPVAELAVAGVPFVAAALLARSGARFVARAMVAVGGLILPVMVVTSMVDGFTVPPDLHGAALPIGAGLACAAVGGLYAARVARRADSALRVMWAPVLWFAAGMAAVGLGRPVPRGEDVAVPGTAQVAVIALALLATTVLAGRTLARVPAVTDATDADADPTPDRPRAALAAGALAAAPAGLVVTLVLALVAGAAEGWPLVPTLVTTTALALAGARVWPTRADALLVGGWLLVLLRASTVIVGTPLLSRREPAFGAAFEARPALVLAALLAGVGLLEWLGRRAAGPVVAEAGDADATDDDDLDVDATDRDPTAPGDRDVDATGDPAVAPPPVPVWTFASQTLSAAPAAAPQASGAAYGVVGWVVALTAVLTALVEPVPWWGVAGAATVAVWSASRRVVPPRLGGASIPVDVLAAVAPFAVLGGVWRGAGGALAGVLAAVVALAVTPLARGRWRRGAGDRFWLVWWGVLLAATVLASGALGADGLLDGTVTERAVVPAMLVLVAAALLVGPAAPVTTVALVAPVLLGLWGAVVSATELGDVWLAIGYAVLGLGAVVAAHLRRPPAAGPVSVAVAVAGYVTGAVAVLAGLAAQVPAPPVAVAFGAVTAGWLVTALAGDRDRSPVVTGLDGAELGSAPWVLALLGLPTTVVATLHAAELVRLDDPWWLAPFLVAAVGYAGLTRVRVPERLRPVPGWTAFAIAVLAGMLTVRAGADRWPAVVALGALVLTVALVRGRHAVMSWTAWATLAPLAGLATWTASASARDLGTGTVSAGALVGIGGLLAVGALLADRARPGAPRLGPQRAEALPPFVIGAVEVVLGAAIAAVLPDPGAAGTLLLAVAGVVGVVAALTGVGMLGAAAVLVAWVGTRLLTGSGYPGAWADLGLAALLLVVALAVSLRRPPDARWARWDIPLAVAAALPAVVALGVATPAERPAVYVLTGALAIGTAVRLGRVPRLRAASETLATTGSLLVLLGSAWAGRGWAVGALLALSAGHTALAAVRETGAWRTARQWIGAVLAGVAWLVAVGGPWFDGDQFRVDATALGGALVVIGVLAVVVAGRLDRSWSTPWGSVATVLAVGACLLPMALPTDPATTASAPLTAGSDVAVGWWQVLAWALLVVAAELAARVGPAPAGWRLVAVAPTLAALLSGLAVASTTALLRVLVLALVSLAAAAAVLVWRRTGDRTARAGEPPLILLGASTLVLAGAFALAGDAFGVAPAPAGYEVPSPVLVAAVLAVAAVEAAGYGVALRLLGLRMAAPVLAWVAWAVYAADAVGGVVAWYTVPVGIAMVAVVEVWRADRRERGLPPSDQAVAALDLAGVAFVVVASFVAAFTTSVLHALVAAGIGVLVFLWAVLTRVRRRLLAGAGIVLAGVVVAVALPLVALVPAWGGAALWVLVAVVGLVVVLAATFLERGRAAVRGGRTRLLAATEGWE